LRTLNELIHALHHVVIVYGRETQIFQHSLSGSVRHDEDTDRRAAIRDRSMVCRRIQATRRDRATYRIETAFGIIVSILRNQNALYATETGAHELRFQVSTQAGLSTVVFYLHAVLTNVLQQRAEEPHFLFPLAHEEDGF